jgi:2-polyprenyl-3-methyl-5-hydroxy-6-metoxy-1,4-benzoquinol methylase
MFRVCNCEKFLPKTTMKLPLTKAHYLIFRQQLWKKLCSRRNPCPLCGSRKATLVYETPNVHMKVFRSIFAERVEKCEDCGLLYTNPILAAKDLEKYYSKYYALEGLPVPRSKKEFLSRSYSDIWFSKDRDISLLKKAKPGGEVLDIGCASGSLLWMAREAGYKVRGVEVGESSARFARVVLNLNVFCGQLREAKFPSAEFDAVTMIHSLEHVPDPQDTLVEVHRILKDDGMLIVIVPNAGGWSAVRDGIKWKWLQPQNHYSHFTPVTLRTMAKRAGFSPDLTSEEGRYGEDEIRSAYRQDEILRIHAELRGSEIILVARKRLSAETHAEMARKLL